MLIIREMIKMQTVDIDEDVEDEPEESERVDLKKGEKSKSQHF